MIQERNRRRLVAAVLCLVPLIGFAGCDSAPKPLAEYDEIKNDPEFAAIANSNKNPKEVQDAIKAKIKERQAAAAAQSKAAAKKSRKKS